MNTYITHLTGLLFLYAIHRFYLPLRREGGSRSGEDVPEKMEYIICPKGYAALLDRRFEEAIDHFLAYVENDPDSLTDFNDDEINLPKRIRLVSDLTFDPTKTMATARNGEWKRESSKYTYVKLSSGSSEDSNQKHFQSNNLLLPSDAASSSLAKAYRSLAFQTLADQVKSSVRNHPGNEWMFSVQSVKDQILTFRKELFGHPRLMLLEKTPVRMDLSHSW